jgi:alpha-mannosidase
MDYLYFVVHTHWDREWYEPFQRMRARLVAMTDRMLDLVEAEKIPCFHFDGQTIVLEDYLEVRPEHAKRIAKLVKAGKISIGPWYVLADSFLVSGESLIRNLEIGGQIARRFGEPLEIGYLPDQFGHIAQMPQILAGFGLKAAVVWRGVGREIARNRFAWQALDGTEIFTTYLPYGYSNGASFPSESVAATLARAGAIAAREREFAAGAPILVMNGTDHAHPDPRLMERLNEAPRTEFNFEVGTLETYVKRLAELPAEDLTRHRGELRSPARAHLLPGVTSARAWIKQRDFLNCYLLERLADPLAALAKVCGHGEDLDSFLDLAWRMEIQNHPHDSICGCSIDQVHQDMRYRFDQASIIGEMVVRSASRAILGHDGGERAIAVFNPSFARRALVTGEVEIEDADKRYAVIDAKGRRIPAAIEVARRGRASDLEMPAPDFKRVVAGLSSAELMGRFVNRFELRAGNEGSFELDLFMSRTALSDLDLAEFQRQIATVPDDATLKIHASTPARAQVAFVAGDLVQTGFSFYRLVREHRYEIADSGAAVARSAPDAAADSIENEHFKLSPSARGLTIEHRAAGRRFELYFEDDGDRGDEYNFDPVPGAPTLSEPESLSPWVIERGPVRSRMSISLGYRIPAALAPGRAARAPETVRGAIELMATLYAGLDRIDFEVTIDNHARDHRLRAALATPISASESLSDTSFGMVRRALEPGEPPGTEDICPTAPHRTLTGVESPELSAALISRGLYEAEVRKDSGGATILLTLLRCVGWLSRADLQTRRGGAGPEMETPGAQEFALYRFEFALAAWKGAYPESELVQASQAYAFPPRLFNARRTGDATPIGLCACDNPRIVFSTARPAQAGPGYLLRAFSSSAEPETACFRFATGCTARLADLAGRAVKGASLKRRDGAFEVNLRPFQIVTFDVRGPTL